MMMVTMKEIKLLIGEIVSLERELDLKDIKINLGRIKDTSFSNYGIVARIKLNHQWEELVEQVIITLISLDSLNKDSKEDRTLKQLKRYKQIKISNKNNLNKSLELLEDLLELGEGLR